MASLLGSFGLFPVRFGFGADGFFGNGCHIVCRRRSDGANQVFGIRFIEAIGSSQRVLAPFRVFVIIRLKGRLPDLSWSFSLPSILVSSPVSAGPADGAGGPSGPASTGLAADAPSEPSLSFGFGSGSNGGRSLALSSRTACSASCFFLCLATSTEVQASDSLAGPLEELRTFGINFARTHSSA